MRAWLFYAGVAFVVTAAGVVIGTVVAGPDAAAAIRFGGGVAYMVQLLGFAILVWVRSRHEMFLVGWGAGAMLRLASVVLVALWLTRDPVYPIRPALLSLVAFVFLLSVIEPLFLRQGLQAR